MTVREPSGTVPGQPLEAVRLTLVGLVQGQGVRPSIARLAHQLALRGCCWNSAAGVTIEIVGDPAAIATFIDRVPTVLPCPSTLEIEPCSATAAVRSGPFAILTSAPVDGAASATATILKTLVPHDQRTCPRCLAETRQPGNRRHGYLLTTCTQCGPRYSILDSMPYERDGTSLGSFPMCRACRDEYANQADRRFHCQAIACPACGPQLWWERAGEQGYQSSAVDHSSATVAAEGIAAAVALLRSGQLVAIRGIGGYQIVADATNATAVERVRIVKGRYSKPLAMMVADLDAARQLVELDSSEERLLCAPENPILLVDRHRDEALLPPVVDGTLRGRGVMLPTTPIHQALLDACSCPLVVTSANEHGDPIPYGVGVARPLLPGVAGSLEHDRPIARPIDDSVVRVIAGKGVTIRLGRGLSPLPLPFPDAWLRGGRAGAEQAILATGGHEKCAIALFNGVQGVLGPHLGTLDTVSMRERFSSQVTALCQLYGTQPRWIAHDTHPDYFTTRWGCEQGLPTIAVQHHHAHVVAAMIEPQWLDRTVLGVAWDGTGYGTDGMIWGGEFLRASPYGFTRVASLLPFPLIGGSAAIAEPWRIAVALVAAAVGLHAASELRFRDVRPIDIERVVRILARQGIDHPSGSRKSATRTASLLWTTSAGRLFDGAAAILTSASRNEFDGDLAMRLESLVPNREPLTSGYSFPLLAGEPARLDWRPLIRGIFEDRARGIELPVLAMRFHRTLARGIAHQLLEHRSLAAVLSGGCFQNRTLTQYVLEEIDSEGIELATPWRIPPGDGGLAAGQLAIALAHCTHDRAHYKAPRGLRTLGW